MCVFNRSGWSWVVKTKSVFKLRFQLVTLRVSLLDWKLFIWTSYTHTHKWPLGAVFDKQTDWIACANVCGFSPPLSSRPLRMGPIYLKDMEILAHAFSLHTCVCAHIYTIHLTIQIRTQTRSHAHVYLCSALVDLVSFNSVFTHSSELPGLVKVSGCALGQ